MDYIISCDTTKMNVPAVHHYLCTVSYWAKGRTLASVKKSIDHSLCFGIYDSENTMLGFARVVSDQVVFAYLMDFFIFEEYQRKGLGSALLKYILDYPDLQVRLWVLATNDARGLYQKFGFSPISAPNRFMFKRDTKYI